MLRIKDYVFLLMLGLIFFISCEEKEEISEKPNVVVILIDDLGYADFSRYGNDKVNTPTIDHIAAKGVMLTNYYSCSPVCSPSRSSLMTGQYPASLSINSIFDTRKHLEEWGMPNFLDPELPNIARTMKENGYATGHFGKWHMGGGRDIGEAPFPSAYGFDKSLVSFEGLGDRLLNKDAKHPLHAMSAKLGRGKIEYVYKHQKTGIYIDSALAFIDRTAEQPFYINLFPNDVHDWHLPKPGTEKEWESVTKNPYEQNFFAVLKALDAELGRFFNELKERGLMENTIIIIASDNGPTDWPRYYQANMYPDGYDGAMYAPGSTGNLKGRKWSLYEGGIRVPLIVYWDKHIPENKLDEKTVMMGLDIYPTLCGLLNIEVPPFVEGQNMSSVLLGDNEAQPRKLFWYYEEPKPSDKPWMRPELAVRSGKWKLIMRKDSTDLSLYDVSNDPQEKYDLSKENATLVDSLMQDVMKWYLPRKPKKQVN